MNTWYAPLASRRSAGQDTAKATGLHDLHARRVLHQGQFWTPHDVARFMWDIALSAHAKDADRGLSVMDNSIGSGRLIQFARDIDSVYGCDIDSQTVQALGDALAVGGIRHDLLAAGMESVSAEGMDAALINPAFSVHLESPLLGQTDFDCRAFGRFGPGTSALSHWFALYQAEAAARVTVALVPRSVVDQLGEHPAIARCLYAIVDLPSSAFAGEGANVSTSILCLGDEDRRVAAPVRLEGLEAARARMVDVLPTPKAARSGAGPRFVSHTLADGEPSIRGDVTGDDRVRIYRAGRKIKLGFGCAFTHARVINAILDHRLSYENHQRQRYPRGITFVGSARLLTEVLLSGSEPLQMLDRLCGIVESSGGKPEPDADLIGYLRRRWRAVQVERTPLQRTIYDPQGRHGRDDLDGASAEPRRNHLCDPKSFSSPMARKGVAVTLVRAADRLEERYRYSIAPTMPPLSIDELSQLVELPARSVPGSGGWRQVAAGRAAAFPARARAIDRRLSVAGADRWLGGWAFQREDVVELCMTRGAVAGHMMALGKSRIAAGCCLAGGAHNAIVVEAGLVDEMVGQFKAFGLGADQYQVIRSLEDCAGLRRINVISYQTLRKVVTRGSKRTFASVLRRRLHTVCADEGSLISHTDTQQTQALYQLSAKRRIALDGTPIPNLPRNLLPLVCWTSREGTASQAYGFEHPFITPELFDSAYAAERGVDKFRDQFVVTEWVTHTFADSLSSGGKKEIPSLANLDLYREFVGCHVLRRVWGEPAVSKHISMEDPEKSVVDVEWDDDHLEHYVATAEEFVEWWKTQRPHVASQKLNLVSVLLRLSAACRAASIPQALEGPHSWRGGLTSKQRWCVETLARLDEEGATTLCFFESPIAASLIGEQLRKQGKAVVEYTGLSAPRQRAAALNGEFRTGQARIMLMTFGVGARGLNLPEASHAVFYDRMWSPRQEQQALFRALRPGRVGVLKAIYAHLAGSVDLYKAQMVAFKQDTANAGLDYATPEYEPGDFDHWLGILDNFVESIGKARIEIVRSAKKAA